MVGTPSTCPWLAPPPMGTRLVLPSRQAKRHNQTPANNNQTIVGPSPFKLSKEVEPAWGPLPDNMVVSATLGDSPKKSSAQLLEESIHLLDSSISSLRFGLSPNEKVGPTAGSSKFLYWLGSVPEKDVSTISAWSDLQSGDGELQRTPDKTYPAAVAGISPAGHEAKTQARLSSNQEEEELHRLKGLNESLTELTSKVRRIRSSVIQPRVLYTAKEVERSEHLLRILAKGDASQSIDGVSPGKARSLLGLPHSPKERGANEDIRCQSPATPTEYSLPPLPPMSEDKKVVDERAAFQTNQTPVQNSPFDHNVGFGNWTPKVDKELDRTLEAANISDIEFWNEESLLTIPDVHFEMPSSVRSDKRHRHKPAAVVETPHQNEAGYQTALSRQTSEMVRAPKPGEVPKIFKKSSQQHSAEWNSLLIAASTEIEQMIQNFHADLQDRIKCVLSEVRTAEGSVTSGSTAVDVEDQKDGDLQEQVRFLTAVLLESRDALEKKERRIRELEKPQHRSIVPHKNSQDSEVSSTSETERQAQKLTALRESCATLKSDIAGIRVSLQANVDLMAEEFQAVARKVKTASRHQPAEFKAIVEKYRKETSERRRLYRELQDMKGNIRVCCRLRPHEGQHSLTAANQYQVKVNHSFAFSKSKELIYEFDRVFGPMDGQAAVFEEVLPLVLSVIDGYNACIMAYGQTGSGKTWTMEGPEADRGITFRALSKLFEKCGENHGVDYRFKVSMVEIHNEKIRDLLYSGHSPRDAVKTPIRGPSLDARASKDGAVYLDGVVEVDVRTVEDVAALLQRGNTLRTVGVTSLNDHSSRSHSVLSLTVIAYDKDLKKTLMGKLSLVDLAGSERLSKTSTSGPQLRETQHINKSLAGLGHVINALSNKQKHIPYRNSKLTFLLRDSLGPGTKTLFILCVRTSPEHVNESVCTLNFGSRARAVELGAAIRHTPAINSTPVFRGGHSPSSPSTPLLRAAIN